MLKSTRLGALAGTHPLVFILFNKPGPEEVQVYPE
jgi:hypothetical protein